MRHQNLVALLIAVLTSSLAGAAHAQSTPRALEAPAPTEALKVFLDCAECDLDYQRQTVTFVEYVRDRAVADLHVLVTTQTTGSGGVSWTVKFIGLGRLQNQDRMFAFATPQRATNDERRRAFAQVFRIGLVGYAAETPIGPQLDVTWKRPARQALASEDPWNSWVFRINANGSLGGEQSSTIRSYRLSVSSSRTTQNWKINLSANSTADKRRFTVGDDRTIDSRRDAWSLGSLVVKSLGGHTSAAFRASMARSSFSNTDRATTLAPGVEYDFFPYSESSRRSLAVQYTVGATSYEYRELTIFDKLRETVRTHGVNVSLGLRQPWGSLSAYSSVLQHLNHTDRYRASVSGSTEVSLIKGVSFNIVARYDRIKDQIALRKSSASTEEILLRLRQLATDYNYSFSVGISYSFGSVFNSHVNPRFGGPGGLVIF